MVHPEMTGEEEEEKEEEEEEESVTHQTMSDSLPSVSASEVRRNFDLT